MVSEFRFKSCDNEAFKAILTIPMYQHCFPEGPSCFVSSRVKGQASISPIHLSNLLKLFKIFQIRGEQRSYRSVFSTGFESVHSKMNATDVRLDMASALAGKIFCQEPPKKDSKNSF